MDPHLSIRPNLQQTASESDCKYSVYISICILRIAKYKREYTYSN